MKKEKLLLANDLLNSIEEIEMIIAEIKFVLEIPIKERNPTLSVKGMINIVAIPDNIFVGLCNSMRFEYETQLKLLEDKFEKL